MNLTKQILFKYKIIDISLILLFAIRGLLTFSRGGMLSAVLTILVVVMFPKAKAAWQDNEVKLGNIRMGPLIIGVILLAASFFIINAFTNNNLLYRYQGKTERDVRSGFDKTQDLEQLSSGRLAVFISDIKMFIAQPAIGVGVGQSAILRPEYGGPPNVQPHLEMSRLLAEHGLPGLVIVIMMYIYPFFKVANEPNNYRRAFMLVMLIMALSVTFHSAMRTMVSPLLFAFAFINLVPTDYDWRAHLMGKRAEKKHLAKSRKHAPQVQTVS
jgi:O-antigen ligase